MKMVAQIVLLAMLTSSVCMSCEGAGGVITFSEDTVRYINPCYRLNPECEEMTGLKTAQLVDIPNGSAILHSGVNTSINSIISTLHTMNNAPNPLKVSHAAIVVIEDPRYVYKLIVDRLPGGPKYDKTKYGGSEKSLMYSLRMILDYNKDIITATNIPDDAIVRRPFAFDSNLGVDEFNAGTKIYDFAPYLHSGNNYYLRPLYKPVSTSLTRKFMEENLCRDFETFCTICDQLRGVLKLNTTENSDKAVCSEVSALFYKFAGLIPENILANNVMPKELSCYAGDYDVLKGQALPDIPLKVTVPLYEDAEYSIDCCHSILAYIARLSAR